MLQVKKLSKEFAGRILFSNVNFTVGNGDKLGLVGRNGCGKSTLFKMLIGKLSQDDGSIETSKKYSVGILEQHLKFTETSIVEECSLALGKGGEFETYKVEKVLQGLGFAESDYDKSPEDFSGGFQIRLNLAKLIIAEPNLLLLDEPTNYLDIVSMRWLQNYLRKYPGEFILITHDRSFMNNVCTKIMGIHRQGLIIQKGSVEDYLAKVTEAETLHENTRLNQEKKRREIEEFVTRFKAKAGKASQAQSRVKMLERMEEFDQLESVKNLAFKFNYEPFQAKILQTVSGLRFGYSEDKILFSNLKFEVGKNDRIAIIGKNGKGKSTLLNLLSGELKASSGEVISHDNVRIGHFGQTNISRLSDELTVEDEIRSVNSDLSHTEGRNICGTMMFSGEDAEKKIKLLSGGEKSRVLLGKILACKSNLLLLDEPTNHLDQESVSALTKELIKFEGASIVVTHNEDVLKELPNKFIVFHKGGCEVFVGSYSEFLEKIGWEEEIVIEKKKSSKLSKKEVATLKQDIIRRRSREFKPINYKISKLEEEMIALEDKIKRINKMLITASVNEDSVVIVSESKRLFESEQRVDQIFEELERLESEKNIVTDRYEKELSLII